MGRKAIPPAERFWPRVEKTEGCWLWTGSKDLKGYGKMADRGKTITTHRLSYELAYGPVPRGLFVCHTCDNPPCVNPAHLWLGTALDNTRDMIAKGRAVRYHGPRPPRPTYLPGLRCDVCQDAAVTVRASSGPLSFAYCQRCLDVAVQSEAA